MPEQAAIYCADCDAALESVHPHQTNADDDYICETCHENYCECHDYYNTVRRDSQFRDDNGNPICEDCGENYRDCADCGDRHNEEDLTYIESSQGYVCNTCRDNEYEQCQGCRQYAHRENAFALADGEYLCTPCRENGNYTSCDTCGELYHDDDTRTASRRTSRLFTTAYCHAFAQDAQAGYPTPSCTATVSLSDSPARHCVAPNCSRISATTSAPAINSCLWAARGRWPSATRRRAYETTEYGTRIRL